MAGQETLVKRFSEDTRKRLSSVDTLQTTQGSVLMGTFPYYRRGEGIGVVDPNGYVAIVPPGEGKGEHRIVPSSSIRAGDSLTFDGLHTGIKEALFWIPWVGKGREDLSQVIVGEDGSVSQYRIPLEHLLSAPERSQRYERVREIIPTQKGAKGIVVSRDNLFAYGALRDSQGKETRDNWVGRITFDERGGPQLSTDFGRKRAEYADRTVG